MKRRGRLTGSNSKRKDRKKTSTVVEAPLYELDASFPAYSEMYPLTTCNVCGGVEDEDLIILCDGPGCTSEMHMYCLTPVLTSVPEGDWYCEACDSQGTTLQLRMYFDRFNETSHQILSFTTDYSEYLMLRQQGQIPLEAWTPAVPTEIVASEFDSGAPDLIGCIIRLAIGESRIHSGRIINRRKDEKYSRWEHQVQFKSGGEGRNVSHTQWLCLNEHACMVGGAVKWVRAVDGAFWPALELYTSGVQLVANRHLNAHSSSTSSSSSTSAVSLAENKWYYLFAEERMVSMNSTDARLVVPFFAKSKESRLYVGKRLNLAYGLALLEREEIQAARRTFLTMSSADTNHKDKLLVDGYTTGTMRAFVESCTRINNPKISLAAPVFENGATGLAVAAMGSGVGGSSTDVINGDGKERESDTIVSLSRQCYRHMLRYEYCRTVGSDSAASTSVDRSSAAGVSAEGESSAVDSADRSAAQPPQVALVTELPTQSVLCLDRGLLEVECGLSIPAGVPPTNSTTTSATQEDVSLSSTAVLFYFPESHSSSVHQPAKPNKRKIETSAQHGITLCGTGGPSLIVKPIEFKEMVFKKYKVDTLRKQEEIFAQKEAEEQEKLQRAAARKARLAEMSSIVHVNPWFADGEDFTRKSSRLSGVARPAYSDIDGENIVVTDVRTTVKVDAPRLELKSDAQMCSLQALTDDTKTAAASQDAPPVTKPSRGSAKSKKKRAQEEEEYQEYLHSAEKQPRLLSDMDRETWVGTVVTYLVSSEKGRVIEYRSGWAVIRTLKDTINCRPYQLEVVESASEAMEQYEEEEMWALCGEDEHRVEESNLSATSAPAPVGRTEVDMDGFEFSDGVFAIGAEGAAAAVDSVGLDDTDMMYNAFVNDEEYEAFLLNQFDPHATLSKTSDIRPQGTHAARQQQLKPSRTKFLETVPLSEEEKKKRLQALTKKREQTKLLLQRGQTSATTTPASTAVPAPVARTISITRKKEMAVADDDVVDSVKVASNTIPTSRENTATKRDTQQQAPHNVIKLGSAPPLARPTIPREASNNLCRPSTDPSRRMPGDGASARRESDPRASLSGTTERDQHGNGKVIHNPDSVVRPQDRERLDDRSLSRKCRDDNHEPIRGFANGDGAFRNRDDYIEEERFERSRFEPHRAQDRRLERDSFGRDRPYERGTRYDSHADDRCYDRNGYGRREFDEDRRRDGVVGRGAASARDEGLPSARQLLSQAQARDPRIQSRLDRDAARQDNYYGPSPHPPATASSAASITRHTSVNTISNTAFGVPTSKGATRDTDYRSMKNSSEAVRTAKANIDYLQASFLADNDPPSSQFTAHAASAPATIPAKKVNFEAKPSSISRSFIDDDVLNITDDGDVGYFSPVSVDDSDDDQFAEHSTKFNVHVDEIDRVKLKPKQQCPSPQQRKEHLPAQEVLSAVATGTQGAEATLRRSRFAPVGSSSATVAVEYVISSGAQEFSVPSTVPDLLAELAKFAEEVREVKEVKDEVKNKIETEVKISKQERRRLKRDALALEKEQEAQRVAAGLVELGEIEEGELLPTEVLLSKNPSKKQRREADSLEASHVSPVTGSKGGRTVFVDDNTLSTVASPNITKPTAKAAKNAKKSAIPSNTALLNTTHSILSAANKTAAQRQPGLSSKYTIDRSYPQFNHRTNELLAVRHMDSVMPQSMVNLTAVLNGDSFFPTLGCNLGPASSVNGTRSGDGMDSTYRAVSPRASRFSSELPPPAQVSVDYRPTVSPRMHEPEVLYPVQETRHAHFIPNALEHDAQVRQQTDRFVRAEPSRKSRFANEPRNAPLQMDLSFDPRANVSTRAQVLYPRTPAVDDYTSHRTRPVNVLPYRDEHPSMDSFAGEFDRYKINASPRGAPDLGRGWEQRQHGTSNMPSSRQEPTYHQRDKSHPSGRGHRRN